MSYDSFLMNSEFSCSVCVVLNPIKKINYAPPIWSIEKKTGVLLISYL